LLGKYLLEFLWVAEGGGVRGDDFVLEVIHGILRGTGNAALCVKMPGFGIGGLWELFLFLCCCH
ncbi:MAG TPA: hypothetical protein VNR18_14975, partial [Hyphomicrobiales bacterium]|nr:hypothetical protein [Hyphomicrobiales bacterium]